LTRVIGLTGGIGTGKSTVAHMLAALGAVVIDADAIVRELQAPGSPALDEIARSFGPEVLDAGGGLRRDALAAVVFRDPEARRRLDAILHPRVGAEMARRAEAARRAGAALVVLDIPLLFEVRAAAGGRGPFALDATVLVYCTREQQIARIRARDGCSRDEAERRLAAQLPIEDKRALADRVIDNSGPLAETEHQVRALVAELTAPARGEAAR
jgi:dephospho-CoA kinase